MHNAQDNGAAASSIIVEDSARLSLSTIDLPLTVNLGLLCVVLVSPVLFLRRRKRVPRAVELGPRLLRCSESRLQGLGTLSDC